jgi:hypothetical protein
MRLSGRFTLGFRRTSRHSHSEQLGPHYTLVDSRAAGGAACNAGSAGIADMSIMGARIRNG